MIASYRVQKKKSRREESMKCLPSPYSYSKRGKSITSITIVFVRVGSRKEKVIYSRKKRNPIATDNVPLSCNNTREKKKKKKKTHIPNRIHQLDKIIIGYIQLLDSFLFFSNGK
jgi:hypothetical protein